VQVSGNKNSVAELNFGCQKADTGDHLFTTQTRHTPLQDAFLIAVIQQHSQFEPTYPNTTTSAYPKSGKPTAVNNFCCDIMQADCNDQSLQG
jgi:hypothetical protein